MQEQNLIIQQKLREQENLNKNLQRTHHKSVMEFKKEKAKASMKMPYFKKAPVIVNTQEQEMLRSRVQELEGHLDDKDFLHAKSNELKNELLKSN